MDCEDLEYIYQGDDTNAFGQNFLEVELEDIPEGFTISKVGIKITNLDIIYIENPPVHFYLNLTSEQTELLTHKNSIKMIAFDEQGRQTTCEGGIEFVAKAGVNQ